MVKSIYDSFKCEADKCRFTCCDGWKIDLDSRVCSEILGEGEHEVDSNGHCPFQLESGLCSIVIENGELELPETCHMFPRLINEYDNMNEYSLSYGCQAVIDITNQCDESSFGDAEENDELPYRKRLIQIISDKDLSIDEAFMEMLRQLNISNNDVVNDNIEDIDSLIETNLLFQDMVVNYLKVDKYNEILRDIADVSAEFNPEASVGIWEQFKISFNQWDELLKKCFKEKIFYSCVSDEPDDIAAELQVIITEYIIVRYAVFLKGILSKTNTIKYEDIRMYLAAFSRILGHNSDAVIELYAEMFGKVSWDDSYAELLLYKNTEP